MCGLVAEGFRWCTLASNLGPPPFETVPVVVWLTTALFQPLKVGCGPLPHFYSVSGVMPLALCLLLGSQGPQHLTSSRAQSTCDGCFACQSICLVISFDSGDSRTVDSHAFEDGCQILPHASQDFPFHYSLLNRTPKGCSFAQDVSVERKE